MDRIVGRPGEGVDGPQRIVVLRTDAIGDSILAAGMLPVIRERFPAAHITITCQEHVAPLYANCPVIDHVVSFNKAACYQSEPARMRVAQQLRELRADLCLNTVFSREALGDFFALNIGAKTTMAHRGDTANMQAQQLEAANRQYTRLAPALDPWMSELRKHEAYLEALGAGRPQVAPMVWTSANDRDWAEQVFRKHGLVPEKTMAVFAAAQFDMRTYLHFGKALRAFCSERGLRLIALGAGDDVAANQICLDEAGVAHVNLSGEATLLQSAEILRRCALAVGTETGLAHLACAVGVRNVVLVGGGHYGRFMPYSPLTSTVTLPLNCARCNWHCRFTRVHCVKDVAPEVIREAVAEAFERGADKPRVYVQDRGFYVSSAGGPEWLGKNARLEGAEHIYVAPAGATASAAQGIDRVVHVKQFHTPVTPPLTVAALQTLSPLLERLGKDPRDADTLRQLRAYRAKLAKWLLAVPTSELYGFDSALHGQVHRQLVGSPLAQWLPTAEDEGVIKDIQQVLLGRDEVGAVLAAMLFRPAHAWDLAVAWERYPAWFAPALLRYVLTPPPMFFDVGEAERYATFLERWVHYLDRTLDDRKKADAGLLGIFMQHCNFIPLYFSQRNLKDLYCARARLIEKAMLLGGHNLHHEFGPSQDKGKIKLGVFNAHWTPATETYATLPVFEHLDRNRFDITLLTLSPTNHPLENYCRSRADRFVALTGSVQDRVKAMRSLDLDILFLGTNLTAVTHELFLLSLHRMARKQVTSICSPTTTGMTTIDAFIAGMLTEPRASAAEEYSEALITIEGGAVCFNYDGRPAPSGNIVTRESLGIPKDTVVFVSGANFFKIIPELRETWCKILAATKDTVLVLYPFGPAWSNNYSVFPFIESFRAMLKAYGVDTSRLKFLKPFASTSDIPLFLKQCDVYLDSFPYTGATSLMDPFLAGVPTVAMRGERLRTGQAQALFTALGITELLASDESGYMEITKGLAASASRRAMLRERIVARMQDRQSPPEFLDTKLFSKRMGEAFLTICERKN